MRGRAGFTLLELVVALAVFAVLATLAYGGLRQVLQALRLQGAWPAPGVLQGESPMGGRDWPWAVRVSRTQDPDVRRLDVAVYADAGRREVAAALVAYLPRPSGPAEGERP